jgi:hypothetical protein
MALKHLYFSATGSSLGDCLFLGQRFDDARPFSALECESWVMSSTASGEGKYNIRGVFGINRWFTMLWRSPEGTAYASDTNEAVWWSRTVKDRASWKADEVGASLSGVWGLSDECVFAWGRSRPGDWVMFQRSGKGWNEIPCPGEVVRLHGLAPNLVYAVGAGGLLARWNGSQWKQVPVDTVETLTGIFVVSPDEYYASGEGGTLLSGGASGCKPRLKWTGPLWDVAKFRDELWLAGDQSGLLRVKGRTKEVEAVKPNVKALSFDARKELLISCSNMIVGTADGKKFMSAGQSSLEQLTASKEPLWKK